MGTRMPGTGRISELARTAAFLAVAAGITLTAPPNPIFILKMPNW